MRVGSRRARCRPDRPARTCTPTRRLPRSPTTAGTRDTVGGQPQGRVDGEAHARDEAADDEKHGGSGAQKLECGAHLRILRCCVQPWLEPLSAQAGDPVQGGVAHDGAEGADEHHQPEIEHTLGRQRGRGVQCGLTREHRADRIGEHQQEDREIGPVTARLVKQREDVTPTQVLEHDVTMARRSTTSDAKSDPTPETVALGHHVPTLPCTRLPIRPAAPIVGASDPFDETFPP